MPKLSIKNKFTKLPMPQKIISVGALFALVSVLLPWYKDIDSFNTGVQFFGVTGPLYLVGYIIIGLSLFSLIISGFYITGRKLPPLPIKESLIYILSGATSLFLLLIAYSVYSHQSFGVNITSKEYQFGMFLAFISSIAVTIGGILQHRESGTSRFIEQFQKETGSLEELDPVVELNNFQQEQKTEEVKQEVSKVEPKIEPTVRPKSSTGVREYKAKPEYASEPTKVRSEPFPDINRLKQEREGVAATPSTPSIPSTSAAAEDKVNPGSVIRMDL